MHGLGATLAEAGVTREDDRALESEFERRLAESATLAFRVAYGVLRRREDAEDVAQEALVRAHRRRESLRDPSRLRGWLARIAWRLAIDHRRSSARRGRREQAWAQLQAPPERGGEASPLGEDLSRAIDELPEKLGLVLVLGAVEGYPVRELAALLGIPEGTVKSRLFLARKRLLKALR